MAGDVIFTEGDQTAATGCPPGGGRPPRRASGPRCRRRRRPPAGSDGLAGAGGLTALIVLLLGVGGQLQGRRGSAPLHRIREPSADERRAPYADAQPQTSRAVSPVLKTAAQLCTDFALHAET